MFVHLRYGRGCLLVAKTIPNSLKLSKFVQCIRTRKTNPTKSQRLQLYLVEGSTFKGKVFRQLKGRRHKVRLRVIKLCKLCCNPIVVMGQNVVITTHRVATALPSIAKM